MKMYVLRFASMASVVIAGFSFEPTPTNAGWFDCNPIRNQANTNRTSCYNNCNSTFTHPTLRANCRDLCDESHRNKMVEHSKCVADPRGYYGARFIDQYLAEVQEYNDECVERAIEGGNPLPF